jgi:hypothetical protein
VAVDVVRVLLRISVGNGVVDGHGAISLRSCSVVR